MIRRSGFWLAVSTKVELLHLVRVRDRVRGRGRGRGRVGCCTWIMMR